MPVSRTVNEFLNEFLIRSVKLITTAGKRSKTLNAHRDAYLDESIVQILPNSLVLHSQGRRRGGLACRIGYQSRGTW